MVSKVKYETLPRLSRKAIKKEPWKFAFALLAAIAVGATEGYMLFPLLVLFVAFGAVRWLVRAVTKPRRNTEEKFDDEPSVEPTSIDT
jgi:hypothetical protein